MRDPCFSPDRPGLVALPMPEARFLPEGIWIMDLDSGEKLNEFQKTFLVDWDESGLWVTARRGDWFAIICIDPTAEIDLETGPVRHQYMISAWSDADRQWFSKELGVARIAHGRAPESYNKLVLRTAEKRKEIEFPVDSATHLHWNERALIMGASKGPDESAFVISRPDLEVLREIPMPNGLTGVAWGPDNETFLTWSSFGKTIHVHDFESGERKAILKHRSPVEGVTRAPNAVLSVAGRGAKVWNPDGWEVQKHLNFRTENFDCLYSPEGSFYVVHGSSRFTVLDLDCTTRFEIDLRDELEMILAVSFAPGGHGILLQGENHRYLLIDGQGQEIDRVEPPPPKKFKVF